VVTKFGIDYDEMCVIVCGASAFVFAWEVLRVQLSPSYEHWKEDKKGEWKKSSFLKKEELIVYVNPKCKNKEKEVHGKV